MSSILNQEWLNQNSLRAYPIKEDCLRVPVDTSGSLITDILLPNYLLVDFVLTMDVNDPVRVYLKQVVCIGNLLTLAFYDSNDVLISLLSVDLSLHVKNSGYNIVGSAAYEDVRGRVVLGDLTNLNRDLPEGQYNFDLASTEFETTTIRPDLRGIRSFQISNEGNESQYIYGHVKLLPRGQATLSAG